MNQTVSKYLRVHSHKSSRFPSISWGTAFSWPLLSFVVLTLIVFAFRLVSVLRAGSLFGDTGAEEAAIYVIWKVIHACPVYESPLSGYFGLGLYNWLFYYSYGLLNRLAGIDGPQIIVSSSLLTLLFAMIGCAGFYSVLRKVTPTINPFWAWIMSLVVWADGGEVGWWQVTVRPDMASMAAVIWGVWFNLKAIQNRSISNVLLASGCFYMAWSFKETSVLIFLSCCIYALVGVRWWLGSVGLVVPFTAFVFVTFVMGGHDYYLNTVLAPSINPFTIHHAASEIAVAFAASPFIWISGFIGALVIITSSYDRSGYQKHRNLFLVAYLLSMALDCVAIGRDGSSRNTLLEGFLVSGIITSVFIAEFIIEFGQAETRRLRLAVCKSIALIALVCNTAIVGAKISLFNHFGRLTLATPQEIDQQAKLADAVKSYPSPIFVRGGFLGMPWISNENRYPVILDDVLFYQAAVKRGLLAQYPLETLIGNHHFRTLLVSKDDPAFHWAIESGCLILPSSKVREWGLTAVSCDQ